MAVGDALHDGDSNITISSAALNRLHNPAHTGSRDHLQSFSDLLGIFNRADAPLDDLGIGHYCFSLGW